MIVFVNPVAPGTNPAIVIRATDHLFAMQNHPRGGMTKQAGTIAPKNIVH